MKHRNLLVSAAVLLIVSLAPGQVAAQSAGFSVPNGILADATTTQGSLNPPGPGNFQYTESATGNGGTQVALGQNSGGSTGSSSTAATGPVGPVLCQQYVVITGSWEIPPIGIDTDPPVPDNTINASDPATSPAALVGTPTFFWNPGYDGTIVNSRDITGRQMTCPQGPLGPEVPQPITLQLHYWVIDYTWDFGDGSQISNQCGSADSEAPCTGGALGRPNTPNVQHVYQTRSPVQTGYMVNLNVDFGISITGDGTFHLPPANETAALQLPVREMQSVLVPVTEP